MPCVQESSSRSKNASASGRESPRDVGGSKEGKYRVRYQEISRIDQAKGRVNRTAGKLKEINMDRKEIAERFPSTLYLSVNSAGGRRLADEMCCVFRDLAGKIEDSLPEGREKSLVMTKLEEAFLWGMRSLTRQDD